MPVFIFRVIDEQDQVVSGTLSAPNITTAQQRLNLVYKSVLQVGEKEDTSSQDLISFRRSPRVKFENLAIYCRQLSVMVNAGIAINRAFRFCARGEDQNLNVVMQRVANDIEEGKSIAKALGEQPRVFNPLFVGLVKAGEASGCLDTTLKKLSDLLEKNVAMQKRVQSALAYPAVIAVVSVAVAMFFTFYIMPAMLPVFSSLGVELPMATRILILIATTARNPYISVPLAIAAAVGLFMLFNFYSKLDKAPEVRYMVDTQLMRIPVLGQLITLSAQSKVMFTLATLLDAGVSLAEALHTVEDVANNEVLARKIKWGREALLNGASVYQAFHQHQLMAPMALQMVKVGEETGTLSDMMARVGALYEEDVEHQLEALASLIEPIIMAIMGLVVGFITIASFLPLVHLLKDL